MKLKEFLTGIITEIDNAIFVDETRREDRVLTRRDVFKLFALYILLKIWNSILTNK